MKDHSSTKDYSQPFKTSLFTQEKVTYAGLQEYLVRGGRSLFQLLPRAFQGISQISVIGWGSQGPAQAQNLRDSLSGSNIKVTVGLRPSSHSWAKAEAAGFTAADGTLQEMDIAIANGDLVILLISDGAQSENWRTIFKGLKPGSTLGLSHGFLLGHLTQQGESFPDNINVIGVCPKGMGPSVRRLYEQGREIDGAGINTSVAIEQDIDGRATDIALGWSIALGAPFTFQTTLEMEYRSDIFGERAILLGAVHGILERLYAYKVASGLSEKDAFIQSVESLTGTISPIISHQGIKGLYNAIPAHHHSRFATLYNATYGPALSLLREIYQEVASGNEIRSVVMRTARLAEDPMDTIDSTPMWRVGKRVRARRNPDAIPLDCDTAAVYCAIMIAQIDLLVEQGHRYSEIVNESVIEAVDSLTPYMHYRGVAYMIDNCSTTARLGARKWAPRFDYTIYQSVLPFLDTHNTQKTHDTHPAPERAPIEKFITHQVHEVLEVLSAYRPALDISVGG